MQYNVPNGMVGVCCQPASRFRRLNAPKRYFLVPYGDYSNLDLKSPIGIFICDPSIPNAPYQEVTKISSSNY